VNTHPPRYPWGTDTRRESLNQGAHMRAKQVAITAAIALAVVLGVKTYEMKKA
jgi:negative regulator of sigma E activity